MIARVKSFLRGTLGLPPAAVMVAAGTALHVATCLLFGRPTYWPGALLTPLLAAIAFKAYEIWHYYRHIGLRAPGVDPIPVILLRHGKDVVKVMAVPVVMVLAGTIAGSG